MIKVKLDYPSQWNFKKTNTIPGIYEKEGMRLEINNDTEDCDFWIVWGDIDKKKKAFVKKENVLFIAEEAFVEKNYIPKFLDQFTKVYGTRNDIDHKGFEHRHYTGTWFIDKTYDELVKIKYSDLEKNKPLSAVVSNMTILEGHKKRFAFINKMIGHFKDDIDIFGRGFNPIEDKSMGIMPYKYSIAIENSTIKDYFSEKILDCFLSYTVPIYYGCPNIEEYFPEGSFIKIDINDYKKSIEVIEKAIHTIPDYEALQTARNFVLHKYSIVPFMYNIVSNYPNQATGKKTSVSISPAATFNTSPTLFHRIKKRIKS